MSSIPVSYSKSVGVLSCVSIIAQSWTIDKVYLISRLQNVELEPWNCYFLSKLLFQSLYFLKALTYTLGVHRVMHYSENLSIKYHDQNFWALNRTNYRQMRKSFVLGGFNKNINFSTKFQYWIGWKTNNLRLAIPHCNIFF